MALQHEKVRLIANALGTPPVEVIDRVHDWQLHLLRLHRLCRDDKPLVFTELGAPIADQGAQQRYTRAALTALRSQGGVLFWNLWQGSGGGTHVLSYPAQAAIDATWHHPR